MSPFKLNLVLFMAMVVTCMHFSGTAAQTTHVVGDTLGWTIPSGDLTAYATWASRQTFAVGDVLVFNFDNGEHDVAEVSAAAYGPCNATGPISLTTTGPATLTLTGAPGSRYYICTFTSHCLIGQKLAINVSAVAGGMTPPASNPAAPPTAAAVPPMTPATPDAPCPPPPTSSPGSGPSLPPTTTSGSMIPPPPPSSGAPVLTVMAPVAFLVAIVAFLNY